MRNLSIRLWLALVLLLLVSVPVFVTIATSLLPRPNAGRSNPVSADDVVAAADRWTDRTWQTALSAKLRGSNENILIFDASGHLVYSSASRFQRPAPTQGTSHAQVQKAFDTTGQTIIVMAGRQYLGTIILSAQLPSSLDQRWSNSFSGFLALLLMLMLIAWFIGPAVMKPLAAMSQAARRIANNELDVQLPCSPVKEIAQVADAFVIMSNALRAAIYRQAELEQERRWFISAIAHDLRTPLFSLRGYLEALETGVARTPEQVEKYIVLSQKKAATLERLIGDLFAYVQLEYLEMPPTFEQVEFGSFLQKMVDSWQPQASGKGIRLVAHGPAQPCLLQGDEHLLARAVENVLDNALRHTPPGGSIWVRWRQQSDRLFFSVIDTGSGIPPKDIPYLFAPLYRGEASRNRQTGGAGLGLAIARRILVAHGGDLTVANVPTGGAEFTGSFVLQRENPLPEAGVKHESTISFP